MMKIGAIKGQSTVGYGESLLVMNSKPSLWEGENHNYELLLRSGGKGLGRIIVEDFSVFSKLVEIFENNKFKICPYDSRQIKKRG